MSPKASGTPILIVHVGDDQLVPIDASAYKLSELVEDVTFKVYEGAPHALITTHKDRLNEDLLACSLSSEHAGARARGKEKALCPTSQ